MRFDFDKGESQVCGRPLSFGLASTSSSSIDLPAKRTEETMSNNDPIKSQSFSVASSNALTAASTTDAKPILTPVDVKTANDENAPWRQLTATIDTAFSSPLYIALVTAILTFVVLSIIKPQFVMRNDDDDDENDNQDNDDARVSHQAIVVWTALAFTIVIMKDTSGIVHSFFLKPIFDVCKSIIH